MSTQGFLKPRSIEVEPVGTHHAKIVMEPFERSSGHTLPHDLSVLERFADADSIQSWARESMAAMAALGIVNGYENNTIGAERSTTRAEAVTMLLRAADVPAPEPAESAKASPEEPSETTPPAEPQP